MRGGTFLSTLVVGALAAVALIPWMIVSGAVFGSPVALEIYLAGVGALYLAHIAPRRAQGWLAALLMGGAALGAMTIVGTRQEFVLVLVTAFGVLRSGLLYQARPARAIAVELGLGISALVFARFLAASGSAAPVLALWGWFLVQSFFFLIQGSSPRAADRLGDPFEQAHARAIALLERDPV